MVSFLNYLFTCQEVFYLESKRLIKKRRDQHKQSETKDYMSRCVIGGLVISTLLISLVSHGFNVSELDLGWMKLIGVLIGGVVGYLFQK